jgi:DICT domain-containing protein
VLLENDPVRTRPTAVDSNYKNSLVALAIDDPKMASDSRLRPGVQCAFKSQNRRIQVTRLKAYDRDRQASILVNAKYQITT